MTMFRNGLAAAFAATLLAVSPGAAQAACSAKLDLTMEDGAPVRLIGVQTIPGEVSEIALPGTPGAYHYVDPKQFALTPPETDQKSAYSQTVSIDVPQRKADETFWMQIEYNTPRKGSDGAYRRDASGALQWTFTFVTSEWVKAKCGLHAYTLSAK